MRNAMHVGMCFGQQVPQSHALAWNGPGEEILDRRKIAWATVNPTLRRRAKMPAFATELEEDCVSGLKDLKWFQGETLEPLNFLNTMPNTFISLGPFITIYDLVCQIQTFEMPVQFKIFLSCSQFHSPSGWVTLTQSWTPYSPEAKRPGIAGDELGAEFMHISCIQFSSLTRPTNSFEIIWNHFEFPPKGSNSRGLQSGSLAAGRWEVRVHRKHLSFTLLWRNGPNSNSEGARAC